MLGRLVRELNFHELQLQVVPTSRAADGLALSSRNVFLTRQQRAAAPAVYAALQTLEALYAGGGRHGLPTFYPLCALPPFPPEWVVQRAAGRHRARLRRAACTAVQLGYSGMLPSRRLGPQGYIAFPLLKQ